MKREIFNKVLSGQCFETVPFWEVWFNKWEMLEKHYGKPEQIESSIRMAQDLGMSALRIGSIDTNCHFSSRETTDNGDLRYAGGQLSSLDQLKERELPEWGTTIASLSENYKKIKDAGLAGIIYLPWCFHTIATGMGLENFAYKIVDDFEFVVTCMQWVEDRNRKAIEQVVSIIKPDAILFDGDCAYKSGLMVNPEIFEKLVDNETLKTVGMLKKLNIPYVFHSDGKLDEVIPFLIKWGFSAVHGCEKQANDLSHLVGKFGNQIGLIGNMDVNFLNSASVDQIRYQTEQMLIAGSKKGRYIAACNTSPQDYIPDENYFAFCDVIKKFVPAD